MDNIKEIYKSLVLDGFYDEEYGNKPKMIDGKMHGVCIDFSKKLIKILRENGYLAGLISTPNEDGYNHAAVLYKNIDTDEVNIADPVTDIRKLTGLTDNERRDLVDTILNSQNWKRELREYIKEFGIVTAYNDDMSISMQEIQDKEELEAVPAIIDDIPKKGEPIKTISSLKDVKNVADGPTLLACQTLYKKGISTYCSNYQKDGEVSINIQYNSLSEENKNKIKELKRKNHENFYIKAKKGLYGELNEVNEIADIDNIDENQSLGVVFGFKNCSGKSVSKINLKMNQLISSLEKQEYLQDSYTREQILEGKHLIKNSIPKNDDKMYYLDGTEVIIENEAKEDEISREYSETNTNDEIARNEGFIYSEKFNRFFKDLVTKSRYIESLYRNEHDLRTETEIANENGVFYDMKNGMFFENEKEMGEYKPIQDEEEQCVTSADIVEADMNRKIPHFRFKKVIQIFQKLINKIRGNGGR